MPFRNHGTIGTRYETMTQAWPKCKTMIDDCQTAAPGSNACAQAQSYCNAQMLGPYEATGLNPYDIREPCKVKPLCYDFTDVEKWYVRGRGCNWNTQYAQYAQYAVCSMQYAVCSMQYAVCSMQCGDLLGGAAVPCEGVEEVGKEDTVGGVVWEGLHPE